MQQTLHNIEQLQGLIAVLDQQEKEKKDYVASSSHLLFVDGKLTMTKDNEVVIYEPTKHFHSQVQEKLGIPAGYYGKMLSDAKGLLDENVNHWLKAESKNFLVRTFEKGAESYNTARALLSDRYSIIDNHEVLVEALSSLKETGLKVDIVNAELSDTRMYLKVVCPEVEVEAKEMLKQYRLSIERGANVVSGFTLSNSEIGAGAFSIMPRAVVLACQNGLVVTKDQLKSIHLGSKMDELGFNQNKDVMQANLRLIREQVKHAVKVFLSEQYLKKTIDAYTALGEPKIEAPVQNVIEVVGKKYNITEERRANILKYFIEGGDTRRFGISSALTRECQDLTDADSKHESEVAGYEVLRDFNQIESAAFKIKRSAN